MDDALRDANREQAEDQVTFSANLVRDVYSRWCRNGQRARSDATVEVASLEYAGSEGARGFGLPEKHLLRDAHQIAEFVRFSPSGSDHGVVLPNPDAHFTPVIALLFAGLNRGNYGQADVLAEVIPVPIRRRDDSKWEMA